MHAGISFSYPAWFLIFCVALGAGYAAMLYARDKTFEEKTVGNGWAKGAMTALRFLCVTVLAILLLSPFIRSRHTETNKPIVAILQDKSESLRHHFSAADSAAYFKKLETPFSW